MNIHEILSATQFNPKEFGPDELLTDVIVVIKSVSGETGKESVHTVTSEGCGAITLTGMLAAAHSDDVAGWRST